VASATERLEAEQAFHDDQARRRAAYFSRCPDALRFEDAAYLDHETWIRPALEQLGDVTGLRVLDFGCGHGMAAVVLARRGARVTAFDLSAGYLAEARARARANAVPMDFARLNGERLPFADSSFDRIWGNAVLHHLNLQVAAPELSRVLTPNGMAVFCEPWGENPLLHWARRHLPYPGKGRTRDEQPLIRKDVRLLHSVFPEVGVRGFQLVSMLHRLLPRRRAALLRTDNWLLERWPGLQRFSRYVVLSLRR
jgi:ubiquinone/menaquinone biosynthesis C-methylase UbiE